MLFDIGQKAFTNFLKMPNNHDIAFSHKPLEMKGEMFFTCSKSFPLPVELMFCFWHMINSYKETGTWGTHRWPHPINYMVLVLRGWYFKPCFFTPS